MTWRIAIAVDGQSEVVWEGTPKEMYAIWKIVSREYEWGNGKVLILDTGERDVW